MMNFREMLVRSSGLAGILFLGCGVFGSLWSALSALGDPAGARFFQGMFWGTVICWGLNAAALVGLLTWHTLVQNQEKTDNRGIVPPDSPAEPIRR